MTPEQEEKREAERIPVVTNVEFHALKDLIDAVSVNISEKGICFSTDEPLKVRMRYESDGMRHEREARLAWTRIEENGQTTYGFEFIDPDPITPADVDDIPPETTMKL